MATGPANGWHWAEWACECAGTALLLFAVVTAKDWVVRAGPLLASVWIRVAVVGAVAGLVVVLVAHSRLGRRSGAHLNPVVTLGLAMQRTLGWGDTVGYVVAQTAGGVAGVALAAIWVPTVSGPAVQWAVIAPTDRIDRPVAAAIEAGATAFQLAIVFACLTSARFARFAPVAAGVLLTATIAVLAPITGAGFNPVRALAPDLIATVYPALWIYFAGPVLGSLVAARLVVGSAGRPRTGKLVHDPTVPCLMYCDLPHALPLARTRPGRSRSPASIVP
jgi:aquaporin Z